MNTRFSIIVPVYNVEKYLERCLNSLVNQTYKNIEIICINDGSTDNSPSILEKFKNSHPSTNITVISQKNEGLSSARNKGLSFAKGDYVSFIDSDDWVDNNYYEVFSTILKNTNYDIVMANTKRVKNNEVIPNSIKEITTNKFSKKIKILQNGSVWDKVYNRKLFIDNNIVFPVGKYYEDNVTLIKLMYYANKITSTNLCAYYYFINEEGICRSIDPVKEKKRNEDRDFISNLSIDFAKEKKLSATDVYNLKLFLIRSLYTPYIKFGKKTSDNIIRIFGKSTIFKYQFAKLFKFNRIAKRLKNLITKSN